MAEDDLITPSPLATEGSVELKKGEEVVLELEASEDVSVEIEQPSRSDSSKFECFTSVASRYYIYVTSIIL